MARVSTSIPASSSIAAPAGDASPALARTFEALLLQAAFAPVARALGFYGDVVVSEVARSVAGIGSGR